MIHLETLHQSPFRRIDLVRIYLGVPQDQDAFTHRLDYDYICVVVSNPRTRQAEVKGLKGLKVLSEEFPKTTFLDFAEHLYRCLGTVEVRYERASGKAQRLYRHGPARWRPSTPTTEVDIKMISA